MDEIIFLEVFKIDEIEEDFVKISSINKVFKMSKILFEFPLARNQHVNYKILRRSDGTRYFEITRLE